MNNEYILQVHDLKKHFGQVKAVDGISFSVAKGQIYGFLGPNGSGKTTTISMILGLVHPTDWNGEPVRKSGVPIPTGVFAKSRRIGRITITGAISFRKAEPEINRPVISSIR